MLTHVIPWCTFLIGDTWMLVMVQSFRFQTKWFVAARWGNIARNPIYLYLHSLIVINPCLLSIWCIQVALLRYLRTSHRDIICVTRDKKCSDPSNIYDCCNWTNPGIVWFVTNMLCVVLIKSLFATFQYIKATSYGCTTGGITPHLVNVSPTVSKMASVLSTIETLPKLSLDHCWQARIKRNTLLIFMCCWPVWSDDKLINASCVVW